LKINVLLVEDDRDLALSIAEYLAFENVHCDHAYNGETGFNLAIKHQYDVILLDINLPKISGLRLCQTLRSKGKDTPILMLTAKDTLDDKEAGFMAGTDDYLVKPFAMKELVLRIKALSKRRSSQSKKLIIGSLIYDLESSLVTREGRAISLTRSNLKLLELLMRRSPEIVSKKDIEEMLWPDEIPESNNLKVQIYQLRQKLDKPFDSGLIETLVGHGFRINNDDQTI